MDRLDAADRALDHEWRLRRSLPMAARRGSLRRDLAAALLQPIEGRRTSLSVIHICPIAWRRM
jgi:hypothetical protein